MKHLISVPSPMVEILKAHFFQSDLEQGAFLFAEVKRASESLSMAVNDCYLVPSQGWAIQKEVYLEMKDTERAKIMRLARDKGAAIIDCHSHPQSWDDVWFSPSDRTGISDYAQYAKWKLNNLPFAAMVWGEESIDAVIYDSDFSKAKEVDEVNLGDKLIKPRNSWFNHPRGWHRFSDEY